MYSKKALIKNNTGLHARPASDFVNCAKRFKSNITITRTDNNEKAIAKSIITVLSLSCSKGTEVELSADGDDERAAIDSLVALIDSQFGEN